MVIDLPTVPFLVSYPQVVESVSVSRAGNRVVAMVEYADPYWKIDMRTKPLRAAERLAVEAFRDACRGGQVTVRYTPQHQCLPMAHWGDPDAAVLANGTLAAKSGYSATLAAANGLVLSPGDLISMTTGDYDWMARVVAGGTAASGSLSVTLNMAVPSYIETGAVVRYKRPRMNTRMLPDTFTMPDSFNPIASFTLIEVPR